MKKLLLASVALIAVGMSAPATAADMPVKYVAPVVFSWTGCYVGVNVGYSVGHSRGRYVSEADGTIRAGATAGQDVTDRFDLSGALAGGQVGCNYQVGAWVWGVEVDGQFTNKEGQVYQLAPFGTGITQAQQTNERWLATARGRIGYAWDKSLLYVTAGGAWSGVEATTWTIATPALTAHDKRTLTGYTVGAGWEYALSHGWSIKSEFLYVNYGWSRFFDPPDSFSGCTSTSSCVKQDIYLNNYIFRWGMNYKFDIGKGKGPVVVTKY